MHMYIMRMYIHVFIYSHIYLLNSQLSEEIINFCANVYGLRKRRMRLVGRMS